MRDYPTLEIRKHSRLRTVFKVLSDFLLVLSLPTARDYMFNEFAYDNAIGSYHLKDNKIVFKNMKKATEDEAIKVLLHEDTHWAEYAVFSEEELDARDWDDTYLWHDERLIEQIATEVAGE